MNVTRTMSLVAAAFAVVALTASNAAAQAPTLSVSANGATVTIEWNGVAGALGYNLRVGSSSGSSNIADVTLPASITRIVVAAPAGSYFLRVRAVGAGVFGPFSNEASVTVGSAPPPGAPCADISAPNVKAEAKGGSVTVSWDGVSGAVGYKVEYSRYSGATELTQTTSGTSHTQYVGMLGTFYVRVVAGNACGKTATSKEVAFKIENQNPGGSGPRTPDPAPGTLIPRSQLGYIASVVTAVANQHRGDLFASCSNHVFMYRVVQALRQIDTRWGLNYKRGWNGDLSHDIVAYNPTNRPDEGESQVYLYDIIAGHCGPNPGPNWIDVTDPTWGGRGNPACGSEWCARWTLQPYLKAGFPPDVRDEQ